MPARRLDFAAISFVTFVLALACAADPALAQAPIAGWGYNGDGGLGDGSFVDRHLATSSTGIADAVDISGGYDFSAAVRTDGTVWCWGRGDEGQMGNGLLVSQGSPVAVTGLTDALKVAVGRAHVLALQSDGSVWAWGSNAHGQLGDGTLVDRLTPVPVNGLPPDVVAVACGRSHSFAVTAMGELWAWGSNGSGELGDGTTTGQPLPILIPGLPVIRAVDGGEHGGQAHSIALGADGSVWTWGANDEGQLGDGTTTDNPTPTQVAGIGTAVGVAAGLAQCLALIDDGTVMAWGDNLYGQLGDGTFNDSALPVTVLNESGTGPLTGITAVAAGTHSMGLRADGTIRAWGYNYYGEIGDGTTDDRPLPVAVACLTGVTRISAADYHSLALGTNTCSVDADRVSCWGYNGDGGLGDGSFIDQDQPVQSLGMTNVIDISGGYDFSAVVRADGTVWCWGRNDEGQLGNGSTMDAGEPTKVPGLAGIVQVAAGHDHALALAADGTVWAWGQNDFGQLGDGSGLDQLTPVTVTSLPADIVSVACGRTHSFAITAMGELWAWGNNSSGELGDGTTVSQPLPILITGLPVIRSVDGGEHFGLGHSIALGADGSVWTWGANDEGQLGDGTTMDNPTPTQVAGVAAAVGVSAGLTQCYALLADGTVMSWGDNFYGQLGDGTFVDSPVPVFVLDESGAAPLDDIVSVSAGTHGLALKSDGTVRAWGYNFYGELGDDTTIDRPLPIVVTCLSDVTKIAAADYHSMALGANACAAVSAVENPVAGGGVGVRLLALSWHGSAGAEVEFALAHDTDATLDVFDVLGRRVVRMAEGRFNAGTHRVRWDGRPTAGGAVASGMYFVRLATPEGSEAGRLLILPR
jgi:alpha-tubulin suppressor-like RCC1 family protein